MTAQCDPVVEFYELVQGSPSVLGRLMQIAAFWNSETGRYERGLSDRYRTSEMDKALTRWHRAFFVDWLSSSLSEKERDAAVYWASSASTREPGKKLRDLGEGAIPPLVRAEERQLFLQDMAFLQALL